MSLSFLCVCLSGASLILLLPAASAQYYDFTMSPDYDYNATFEYSLFSNGSSEDLDKLSEGFVDREGEEDTGETPDEVTVTLATTQGATEKSGINVHNVASLPFSLDISMLVWTLMILVGLLQHTL